MRLNKTNVVFKPDICTEQTCPALVWSRLEWSPTHRTLHPGFAARVAGSWARGDQTINISNPRSHHIYDGKTGEETAISSELCNRFDRLMLFNTEREKEFDKIK